MTEKQQILHRICNI